IQYRELKAALNVSDGKLKSNLKKLEETNYIEKNEIQLDNKKLDIYYLTESGKNELNKIIKWMNLIKNVVKNN
ncbi:MAG: transcriptional regulator, partial [Candidatus Helarchaeota archaeon]